ncbi:copper resistance CopC family protein [Microbacterium tumbae]
MSPVRRIGAGLAVATVATLATAAPASAHDELTFSDPAAEARLDSAPEEVTMEFSGDLLTLGESMTGAVVLVIDGSGRDWATGDPEVIGNSVTVDLDEGMPDAGYQVRWQVVSEDGHPISGVIPFTIGDAEPFETTTAEQALPSDGAADAQDQTVSETSSAMRIVLVGAGGAAIAAVFFALYRFLRRPRTAPAQPDAGESAGSEL